MTYKFISALSLSALMVAALWSGAAQATGMDAVSGGAEPATEARAIPADEVMSLTVAEGQVLHLPREAVSVFVANPEIADVQVKSGSLLYLLGRRVGQTSFYAVDSDDKVVASRQIVVGMNLSGLRRSIRQVTGDDRVRVEQVEDMLLLSGRVGSATTAQDVVMVASRYLPSVVRTVPNLTNAGDYIINRMQIDGSNQVNIRVRVAEVSREGVKRLGIGSSVENPNLFGDVDMAFGFDSGVTLAGAAGTAGLSTTWGATSLSTALDALVDEDMATVLAEPNLTALSGETANFLAGGEFPIPIVDSTGQVTVEFREFGIRLAFTPTVINGDRINLRVRPEVSDRDDSRAVNFGSGSIPGLLTRRAETSVELGSGQSFAIAGLLQNNTSQNIQKFPGLGDIPVIGALFRSQTFQQNESELVILVTPYLVKPVSANALQLPTDSFVPPNDVDRLLNNRFVSPAPAPAPVHIAEPAESAPASSLVGPVGYVLQ